MSEPINYDDLCKRLRLLKSMFDKDSTLDFGLLIEAADAIEVLRADNAALQAKIDALMFEYCPVEMTEAQRANWTKHQTAALLAGKVKKTE